MHLRDMAEVREFVDRIETDRVVADKLASAVANLRITRKMQAFGTLCGRECTHLLFHHDAKEIHVFPVLEVHASAGIAAVVAKLSAEHLVTQRLLDDSSMLARAVAASQDVETYVELQETFASLNDLLGSHFGDEETELQEALGVYGTP